MVPQGTERRRARYSKCEMSPRCVVETRMHLLTTVDTIVDTISLRQDDGVADRSIISAYVRDDMPESAARFHRRNVPHERPCAATVEFKFGASTGTISTSNSSLHGERPERVFPYSDVQPRVRPMSWCWCPPTQVKRCCTIARLMSLPRRPRVCIPPRRALVVPVGP